MNLARTLMSRTALAAVVCLLAGSDAWAVPVLTSSTSTRGDGYTVIQFTSGSGTWTVPSGVSSLEVLVVGGGGSGAAGGTWTANGGGGGGVYNTGTYSVTPGGSVLVTVGLGGAALAAYGAGNNGGYSQFDQLIAYGGQGGPQGSPPLPGGASGGYSTNGGGTVIPGIAGASGGGSSGGSGAGGAGVSNYGPSYGGIGLQSAITTGTLIYYAGGGGGGYSGDNNNGGLGGGGKGATDGEPGFGHDATFYGGGGGASRDNPVSGSGFGGLVAVAYVMPVPEPSTIILACCGAAFGAVVIRRRRNSGR